MDLSLKASTRVQIALFSTLSRDCCVQSVLRRETGSLNWGYQEVTKPKLTSMTDATGRIWIKVISLVPGRRSAWIRVPPPGENVISRNFAVRAKQFLTTAESV